MKHLLPALLLSCSTLPAFSAARAQTGPFQDGELLCLNDAGELLRIDPDTGDGEVLLPGVFAPAGPGYMVYDAYRDGVLLSSGLYPLPFDYKLRLVDAQGTATVLGSFGSFPAALAPRGDGIVYFQQNLSTKVEYLDANNVAHDLIDAGSGQPFQWDVAHMIYHPQTNSLFGANSWYTGTPCGDFHSLHVLRVQLSADGTQAVGAVACNSQIVGSGPAPVGLSRMYGGGLMVCSATGGNQDGCILAIDPLTLGLSKWANPDVWYMPIQGGTFSRRLGKTVLLDAGANVLKTYGPGQTGAGTLLATDVVVDDFTSGWSAVGHLVELDVAGGSCSGLFAQYGTGLAGMHGFVPQLGGSGCSEVGQGFSVVVGNAVGGSVGLLALATGPASIPLFGGTLLVSPIVFTKPFATNGAAGVGGAGSASMPFLANDPALIGAATWAQAGILDAAAPQGFALTNGLKVVIG